MKPNTESTHTALPWSTRGAGKVFDQYGHLIADCPAYGAGFIPAGYLAPWHSSDTNAAMIVRAVNSHAELVAVVRDLLAVDSLYPRTIESLPERIATVSALQNARALLARLEK